MPPPKKKLLQETILKDGKIQGYHFQNDDYANQMAYLFGGKKGELAAKKILAEANDKYPVTSPHDINFIGRKKFIEESVKQRAVEVDNEFHKGIFKIFSSLQSKESPAAKGEEASKNAMVDLMKGLGLNVDDDNVQTHYDPGPPTVFQVTWVNRPTANLKDENSPVNQLAECYAKCLSPTEKQQFDTSWKTHRTNATNGEPKIEKSAFLKQADQSFQDTLNSLKNPETQNEVRDEGPMLTTM